MSRLSDIAGLIMPELERHVPVDNRRTTQVLALAEEVGEFVAAYRRWSGQARRGGTFEDMTSELADVVITAYVTANAFGLDLDEAVEGKLVTMFARPWKE